MLVNALLGTVLWATYTESSSLIEPYLNQHPTMTAALSGGIAGGCQAIVAAPAENVRLLLEGGSGYHSWSHAWRAVFKGTETELRSSSRERAIEEAGQVRSWMKDVGEMAGRGWNGWGWGCAKDITGFAIFFSIFEVTRRVALQARERATNFIRAQFSTDESVLRHSPKIFHGMILVSGGVLAGLAYELAGRPWDHARRIVHIHNLQTPAAAYSPWVSIARKSREDGLHAFFRSPLPRIVESEQSVGYRPRLTIALRTLGRVGPWGVGFLVWEAFGPGLQN